MKIGFIGLGIMGKPMVRNLLKAGHELVVYDVIPSNIEEVVNSGAKKAASSKEVAASATLIITMLPNSPEVKEVVLGENGVLEGAKPGSILIDMSSIAPLASQEICKACADEVYEILLQMGSSAVYCGEIGAGNTTKLANQVIVACNIAALSEAYMLSARAGVDPKLVFAAIKGGLAGSTVMNAKSPMIFDHNFKPGFKVYLHIKDLKNALDTGHAVGSPLPLTALVFEMLQTLHSDGCGQNDHSAIAKFYEKVAGKTIC
jgi:2-hydroxy-3-oxopropionate reductase